ncbi:MAG: TlpA family protein disulfide reductase [Planctomycetota bacterium]
MKPTFFVLIISLISIAMLSTSCRMTGEMHKAPGANEDLLNAYQGKVLVLLMGMPGCGGTANATDSLEAFHKTKPDSVEVLRLDVPPPGGAIGPQDSWNYSYSHAIDAQRTIADRLGFFYYPTLYILDQEGEVRYSGEYNDKVSDIVKEIAAEKPGAPKRQYSPTMLSEGQRPEAFSCKDLGGDERSLNDLSGKEATLVIFSSLTCPFSKKAVAGAPDLAAEFKAKGASVIVINRDSPAEEIRSFYKEAMPEIPVLVDHDGALSENRFGVTAVPFCYVLNKDGQVAYRMPFTAEAAQGAMRSVLGLTPGTFKVQSKGAG